MNREYIDINDFTLLIEGARTDKPIVDSCRFDEPVIAVAFYGSGNVDLNMRYNEEDHWFHHTKGMVLSFYADETVDCEHHVSPEKPLDCLVIATATRNLQKLPNQEGELFEQFLTALVNPQDAFVKGPMFYMSPDMMHIVNQILQAPYQGKTKMMFFRSQVTALLSHYFGQLALMKEEVKNPRQREQLDLAREILLKDLENPPSLNDLARAIGFNSHKLKKEFKAYFGLPVFKYLQNERLSKAHNLIKDQQFTIQEAAWNVGYESLSSFSNAFEKHFGYRPSQLLSPS